LNNRENRNEAFYRYEQVFDAFKGIKKGKDDEVSPTAINYPQNSFIRVEELRFSSPNYYEVH